jgi:hypothetical protein
MLLHAGIYQFLLECGEDLPGLRQITQSLIKQKYVLDIERAPFRVMDLSYTLAKARLKNHISNLNDLYHQTLLHKNPPILFLQDEDVYAITHVIFYLSDYGAKKIYIRADHLIEKIKWNVTALMGLYLRKKNWDILAELLLCCHFINWFPYPIYEVAWNAITSAQRLDGTIPGPYAINGKSDIDPEDKENYFIQNYHTTLLTLLASLTVKQQNHSYHSNVLLIDRLRHNLSEDLLKKACKKAYGWLENLDVESPDHSNDIQFLLHILVGKWIYINAVERRKDLNSLYCDARILNEKIDDLGRESDIINCDAALALLSAGIFRKLKLKSKVLENFVHLSYRVINSYTFKSYTDEAKLFLTRILLHKINSVGEFKYNQIPEVYLKDLVKTTNCMNGLDILFCCITAITMFGHKKISNRAFLEEVYTVISSFMFHALSEYNIDLGLKLLRGIRYLDLHKTKTVEQSLNYIINQQRQDGRFGFFGPESVLLSKLNNTSNCDVCLLYLPVTVSAIWTFAEIMSKDFILIHSI